MKFAKFENGNLIYLGSTLELEDGTIVSADDDDTKSRYSAEANARGYLQVVEQIPANVKCKNLVVAVVSTTSSKIYVTYKEDDGTVSGFGAKRALETVNPDEVSAMTNSQKSSLIAELVRNAVKSLAVILMFAATVGYAATVSYPDAKTEPSVVKSGKLTDDSEILDVASTTNAVRETALRARDKDDLAVYTKTTTTVGGKRVVTMTPEADNSLLTSKSVASMLPTEDELKGIAGDALNTIYDEKLKVTWKAVMHDGCLYYVAWTNAVINIQ